MTILLDNTVLANFSIVERPELVRLAFTEPVAITMTVKQELVVGVQMGHLAACDWSWLTEISLTAAELDQLNTIMNELDQGEASCLAVAIQRGYKLATDDKDARRWARQLGIAHTGTLGILATVVKKGVISLAEGNHLLQTMVQAGYYSPLSSLDEIL